MAINIGDIQFVYSGGSTNSDQMLSLGGAISTDAQRRVRSQEATQPTQITGVTIVDAFSNPLGDGTLSFNSTTKELLWRAQGSATFYGVVLAADGLHTIGSASGYLLVSVTFAALPTASRQETITISSAVNKTFDNVSALESMNGATEYRCFYVINTAQSGTAYDVRVWIKSQPVSGADQLSLALDPAAVMGQALGPLVNETDSSNILGGLTFSAPSSQATGLQLGNLVAGQYRAFWVKRHVPVGTTAQTVNNRSSLGISVLL